MSRHCQDNSADRAMGALWEAQFGDIAAWYGKAFIQHQLERNGAARWQYGDGRGMRSALIPDTTVFSAPGEHHEIKHKQPTKSTPGRRQRCYGYERYRLVALVAFRHKTQQPVLCTIHDWEAAGARQSSDPMPNMVQDWRVVDVLALDAYVKEGCAISDTIRTYLNGRTATVEGYYWPIALWLPLDLWWGCPD